MEEVAKVEHVVVLMLENRSFDHLLGFLDLPGLDPLGDEDAIPVDPTVEGPTLAPYRRSNFADVSVDPGHGYPDVMRQLTGREGPWEPLPPLCNNGFIWNYVARSSRERAAEIMGCCTDVQCTALWALARNFAVCSRWFCSVPSETWPNRLFAHTGTSDGTMHNEVRPYTNPTIFERLTEAGRTWRVYIGDIAQVLAFTNLLWHPGRDRFDPLDDFFEDAREGRLPDYSFLEPRHLIWSNSQHPRQDVRRGDRLIRDVYEAISANPETWNSVLLVITYDEHGGFFDRVAPPATTPPTAGAVNTRYGFGFDLLGPRVPAVVVSPYVREGRVDETIYDHSSIVKTVRDAFAIEEPLTDRDQAANSVLQLLELDEPRSPPVLPSEFEVFEFGPRDDPEQWAEGVAPDGTILLDDFQKTVVELADLVEKEKPPDVEELVPAVPPPRPPFRSDAEVEEFVADFQRRHIRNS